MDSGRILWRGSTPLSTADWQYHARVAELALSKQSSAEAVLADGRCVALETFACFLDWFGNTYETQIAASDGEYALLGTMLLDSHHLDINYTAKSVELT